MRPHEAVTLFLESCRARHLSENSIAHAALLLGRFAEWCETHRLDDLRNATAQHLHDYHRWVRRRKAPNGKPTTVKYQNRHIRMLKQLFKLLAERNLILEDIAKHLPPLSDPKDLPRGIMNKDQVMKLLRQPYMTTPLGFRDRAMMEVLYSTALRGGELCRLTLYDVDFDAREVRVLCGKGKKDRVVPMGKVACGYLAEYIKVVRPILQGKRAIELLFLTATGHKLRTFDLGRIIKGYREKAGLPDNITTHSLRHTCATEMLKGGASIRHVQELLGHADIMTTQIYTHVVANDLKEAHRRYAPSERRKADEQVSFNPSRPRCWNDNKNAAGWHKKQGKDTPKKARKKRRKGVRKKT